MPQLKLKYICQMSSPSDQTYSSTEHEHCYLQLMQFHRTLFSRREIGFYTHIYQNFNFKLCVVMVLAPTRHPRNGFSRELENYQGGGAARKSIPCGIFRDFPRCVYIKFGGQLRALRFVHSFHLNKISSKF